MKACGIVVAAGSGSRMGGSTNKALMMLAGSPLFLYALRALAPVCAQLILVVQEQEREAFRQALAGQGLPEVLLVPGGATRRHSVENALARVNTDCELVLVHDAARPLASARLVEDVVAAAEEHGAAVPALAVDDTLRYSQDGHSHTVSREGLYRVQTPQGFHTQLLKKAYAYSDEAATDDAGLVERLGHPISLVAGEARNLKITRQEDYALAQLYLGGSTRVGLGFDTHRLVEGRPLILGGVHIPHDKGLLGHSDADVALHALTDALLGACALGDIGRHFPDNQAQYKGADSLELLKAAVRILSDHGYAPLQCDLVILAQAPKLAPHIEAMRARIASALGLPTGAVSLKATTTEGLGPEGRGEGISAQAIAQVRHIT